MPGNGISTLHNFTCLNFTTYDETVQFLAPFTEE